MYYFSKNVSKSKIKCYTQYIGHVVTITSVYSVVITQSNQSSHHTEFWLRGEQAINPPNIRNYQQHDQAQCANLNSVISSD